MRLFVEGSGLLSFSFVVHLTIWRIRLPQRQIRALLCVFLVSPILVVLASRATGLLPEIFEMSRLEALRVGLFYASGAFVYVIAYSAIENESPTLAVMSFVAGCGEAGCRDDELRDRMTARGVADARLQLMESGGLVAATGEKRVLTAGGRVIAALFEAAGKFFRLPLGG